jgi:hypothetical protein
LVSFLSHLQFFLPQVCPCNSHMGPAISIATPIRKRFGSLTVLASLGIPFWARLRLA